MSIKYKIILALSISLAFLATSLYFSFSKIVLERFEKIEIDAVTKDAERALRTVENFAAEFEIKTTDWAKYDESYSFLKKKSKEYEESMLNYETLLSFRARHVIFYDSNWKYYFGVQVDVDSESVNPLSENSMNLVGETSSAYQAIKGKEAAHGIIQSDKDGVLFLSSVGIQDSARSLEPNGTMVITMKLDDVLIAKFADQTRLNLEFVPFSSVTSSAYKDEAKELLSSGARTLVRAISDEKIGAFGILKDISGNPVLMIRIVEERPVYAEGKATQVLILVCVTIFASLAVVLSLFLLNRTVIARIYKLSEEVKQVALNRSFGKNVSVNGNDEITSLAKDMNSMLGSLNESHKEVAAAKNEAERANKAKSTFVATVSHELRTPLHGIIGILRILWQKEKAPSVVRYLNMAQGSAYGLLSTINDILDLSKVEAGKLELTSSDFDLRSVIREVLHSVAPRVEEKKDLEVVVEIQDNIPNRVFGDPLRVRQVLLNLIGNGVKFTEAGYVKVKVQSEFVGDKILLKTSVTDTGIGIPPHRLGAIFEPFSQADGFITRRYQGTGLGLTIASQLVHLMGGEISVTSAEGVGTEFQLSFQVSRSSSDDAKQFKRTFEHGTTVGLYLKSGELSSTLRRSIEQNGASPKLVTIEEDLELCDSIIVDGALLENKETKSMVYGFANRVSSNVITVILSPAQMGLYEELHSRGIQKILFKPTIIEDIISLQLDGAEGSISLPSTSNPWASTCAIEGMKPLNVLIADDTPTNQIILSSMLEEGGHKATLVGDGEELLKALDDSLNGKGPKFDLIFTDVQMPKMDGLTATRLIREQEAKMKRPHIPVVAVTAHAMTDERGQILESGVSTVITKPIEPAALKGLLNNYFRPV